MCADDHASGTARPWALLGIDRSLRFVLQAFDATYFVVPPHQASGRRYLDMAALREAPPASATQPLAQAAA